MPLPRAADITIQGHLPVAVRPKNVLFRDEVDEAVQAGLAYFLQKVDLQALCDFSDGERRPCSVNDPGTKRFVGFQIVAMRPAMAWLPFDFAPGDVVTHINGTSVEHYDAVIPLFEGLTQVDLLEVSVLRGTETVTVQVRIEPRTVTAPSRRSSTNQAKAVETAVPSAH